MSVGIGCWHLLSLMPPAGKIYEAQVLLSKTSSILLKREKKWSPINFLDEPSSNFDDKHFFNQKKSANLERGAILISLVYHCPRKEIRLITQDLPPTKACWQRSPGGLISFESFVTKASWNWGQHMLRALSQKCVGLLNRPVNICH